MIVPFMDLPASWAEVQPDIRQAIESVIQSCGFAGNPPAVHAFEEQFARYCGVQHCVAVGSGTAALEVLLRAFQVGSGDEVILPANTFVAAAEAICLVGARPVFLDVSLTSANLEIERVAAAITPRTRGIIPVHLYGQPISLEPLRDLAGQHGLWVIEDASQAHGALVDGRRVGSLADAAAFSFYPSKNLGAGGEAGCITTNNPEVAERARKISDHGADDKYRHELLGRNDRMDGIQAAMLSVRLSKLDSWNQQRRKIAELYLQAFADIERLSAFRAEPTTVGVYHLFVVRAPNRDRLRKRLHERGISTGLHYPIPLHLQPAYESLGPGEGELPVCEQLASEVVSLLMYPQLSETQAHYVVDQVAELLGGANGI